MDNAEQKGLLEDLILEMMESNQNMVAVDKKLTMSNDYLNNVTANTWATFEQLHIIANILSGNQLAALEKAKEDGVMQERMLKALEGISENTKEKKKAKELDMSITSLGSLASLLQGIVIGYWKQFKALARVIQFAGEHIIKTVMKFGSKVGTAIVNAVKNSEWIGHFKELFQTIKTSLHKKLVSNIVGLYMKAMLWVDDLGKLASKNSFVSKMVKLGGTFVEALADTWSRVSSFFKNMVEGVKDVWKVTAPVRTYMSQFGKWLGKVAYILFDVQDLAKDGAKIFGYFAGKFKELWGTVTKFFGSGGGSLLGKLGTFLGRFGWFMTIWDVIMGVWDGFQKDGIMGAILGGIKGFFKGFAELGNMIKDLASWALKKLGFEELSKALDSFDLVSLVNNSIDGIANWFKTLFTDPTAALSELWQNLVGKGGLIDLLWWPLNTAIDWLMKKLGFVEADAPKFSMGDIMRTVWNTLIDWVASLIEAIPVVGKKGADMIRGLQAGEATVDVKQMATKVEEKSKSEKQVPAKVANNTGDQLQNAASEKKNTDVVAEAARDSAIMSGVGNTGGGGGGSSTVNASSNTSNIHIQQNNLPDRTDWSVMSGSFGLAP